MTLTQRDHTAANTARVASESRPGQAEFYRAEAARLRDMASSAAYREVRQGLLCVVREYELLAEQRDELDRHRFGEPLRRPAMPDGYPPVDDRHRNSNSTDRHRKG